MKGGLAEFEGVVMIARLGSFRAAAEELGLSTSALSHGVAALERRLGVRLFNRTTRSVSPTDAGAQFIARIAPALVEIGSAIEDVNSHRDTPAGTLRINTSAGAGRMTLTPIFLEYLARFPDMNLVLATEGRLVDIVQQGFDAGIRLMEHVPQDMIAVPIGGPVRMIVVATPGYLAQWGTPQVPADLLHHRCIRARLATGAIWKWEFERRGEAVEVDVPGALVLDEMTLMQEAVLAGIGLAYLNEWSVREHVAQGRLVAVLEDWSPPYPGLTLYYPGNRHTPAGLRALVQLIRERNLAEAG
ncbi:DNA-binding transcriptional LysR family regulator [Novosphingobium sp. PhB57]|uniref:LysR family transcriptional regulator n=1 Tax=Novosphingobium sp. PhB57 TaxID=2485107 RepID=UPI0010E726A1|nr:LysR family transcriptional regulator [Novosphingobium sp. PhB57]TCU58872.1 DNA-binding transcriptional LysR family regulator [Novosphingobium sp. PhB57]